ncbi:MAG: hypothetical protein ACREPN_01980 [Rudaea sp.]
MFLLKSSIAIKTVFALGLLEGVSVVTTNIGNSPEIAGTSAHDSRDAQRLDTRDNPTEDSFCATVASVASSYWGSNSRMFFDCIEHQQQYHIATR